MEYIVGSWSPGPEIQNTTLSDPSPWLVGWAAGGTQASSGAVVNATTTLGYIPIWQAINIYAGTIAILPSMLKRKSGDTRTDDENHVAWRLLNRRPNPLMNPGTFKELMMLRALLWGNGVAEIARSDGRPTDGRMGGLTPLLPEHTKWEYDEQGKLWITTTVIIGSKRRTYSIDPDDAFHIMGLSGNGIYGYSLVTVLKNALGGMLGRQSHGEKTFANNATPSGVLQHPGRLTEEAANNLRTKWDNIHRGLDNVARVAILAEGMTYAPTSMTMEDAQFIESVKLDREMAASLFGLPAHLLNALERATFSNIEEQNRDFIVRSLARWTLKWSEETWRKLLTPRGQEVYELVWDYDPILKGTLKERFEAYNTGIASTMISPNEARQMEGWNPRDGGDEFSNPNTSSGASSRTGDGGGDTDSDPTAAIRQLQERHARLLAAELRRTVNIEDQKVRRAAQKESNFAGWVNVFYKQEMYEMLSRVLTPGIAHDYCVDRHAYWTAKSYDVHESEDLVDAVDQQMPDQSDRTADLLNKEMAC